MLRRSLLRPPVSFDVPPSFRSSSPSGRVCAPRIAASHWLAALIIDFTMIQRPSVSRGDFNTFRPVHGSPHVVSREVTPAMSFRSGERFGKAACFSKYAARRYKGKDARNVCMNALIGIAYRFSDCFTLYKGLVCSRLSTVY